MRRAPTLALAALVLAACTSAENAPAPGPVSPTKTAAAPTSPASGSTPAGPSTANRTITHPTASPEATTPAGSELRRGETATFEHFTVRVDKTRRDPVHGLLVRGRVCVRKLPPGSRQDRTRLSWDLWRVAVGERSFPAQLDDALPVPENLFPTELRARAGQCVTGWVPFSDLGRRTRVSGVVYENEFGDAVVFQVER